MTANITINTALNGIEITFSEKPAAGTIASLKDHGFRWHSKNRLWYAKNTPERMAAAQAVCSVADYARKVSDETRTNKKVTPASSNKFGVQVGDIFHMSWGWEQTNNDFFQVVELVGKSSVRVREVIVPVVDSVCVSSMSENRTVQITRDILPASPHSIFIEDQENGDLKRLNSYAEDGKSDPFFKVSNRRACLCTGSTKTVYDSWYA